MTKSAPSQPSRRRGYRQVPNSRACHSSGVERCRPQRHLLDEDRRTHDLALGRLIVRMSGSTASRSARSSRSTRTNPHGRAGGKVGTLVHARQITEADCAHPPTPPIVRANGKSVGLVNAVSSGNASRAANPFPNAGRVRTDSAFHSAEDVRLAATADVASQPQDSSCGRAGRRRSGRVAKTTPLERESDPTSKAE